MSSSRALCCLLSVKEQKHDFNLSVQCIIKQLLDSVFVISRIIEVLVRVISLNLRLRLITHTSTLITLDITKTSSNNCLLLLIILIGNLHVYKMKHAVLFAFSARPFSSVNRRDNSILVFMLQRDLYLVYMV